MEKLLKITFIISLIGILFLIILSQQFSPNILDIKDIDESYLDKKVAIKGTIFDVSNYEESNFQILTIRDSTGLIKVTSNSKTSIEKTKDTLIITGTVTKYNNELQITADEISKLP